MPRTPAAALLAIFILFGAACGDDAPRGPDDTGAGDPAAAFEQPFGDVAAYPVVVSSELTVGKNRLLIGLLNDEDQRIGSPDIDVAADFYDLAQSATEPVSSADLEFVWTIEPIQGVYMTQATFDSPGKWGAEVSISGRGIDEKLKTSFEVRASGTTPQIGSKPPASDTPTAAEVDSLEEITTDPKPNPRFYRLSIAEAIRSGRPSVIVFATPEFCASQVCGPTLDIVKEVAPEFPKMNFIHVEVYELPADPSNLKLVPSIEEWGLPTEPWVFVLDRRGRVAAKYEGTVGSDELRSFLQELQSA